MFKEKSLTVGQIVEIDKALDDVVNMSISNGRLSYKLGRMKDSTEKIRQRAEKAQNDLFRSLGEEKDGRYIVPIDKRETLEKELEALNEAKEKIRIAELKISELEKAGVYLKPTFFKALGDLVAVDEPEEE
jgi:hypothetical protein